MWGLSKIESIIYCGFETSCKHGRFDRRSGALTYPSHMIFGKLEIDKCRGKPWRRGRLSAIGDLFCRPPGVSKRARIECKFAERGGDSFLWQLISLKILEIVSDTFPLVGYTRPTPTFKLFSLIMQWGSAMRTIPFCQINWDENADHLGSDH